MRKKMYLFLLMYYFIGIFNSNVFAYNFYKEDDVLTDSILMVNLDTDSTVYEKNANKKRSIASTTKIMTYIITAENVKDLEGTKVTVSGDLLKSLEGTDSSISGLRENDVLSVKDLLYCLMIPSGNDAALVLSNFIGNGNINTFVDMMNKKAQELGCYDTSFANPHGLYDDNHYSTANDMYKIAKYALSLPYFKEICNTTEHELFNDDRTALITTNKLIDKQRGGEYYYEYASGIKTGYIDEAGYCLISTATKGECTYMIVALGAPVFDNNGNELKQNLAMIESKKLYKWAFNSLKLQAVCEKQNPIGEVKSELAWKKDHALLYPQDNIYLVIPVDLNKNQLEYNLKVPESIDAPVEMGDIAGTLEIAYNGEVLAIENAVFNENIPSSLFLMVTRFLKNIFFSKLFISLFLIFILMVIMYIIVTINKNKKRKYRMKSKKKYKNIR